MLVQKNNTASGVTSQRNLNRYIQSFVDEKKFSGSVLIAKEGNVLLCSGYGMADYDQKTPNTPHTKFRIASITKQFTAAAVLRLQEKGLISVYDTIDNFIPNYPNGNDITVHHLLTHSGGIANYTDFDEYWSTADVIRSHENTITRFKDKKPYFEPGDRVRYNNTGYVLLAYIIEHISKMSFIDFLKQEFFDVLGMENTDFASNEIMQEPGHAKGYVVQDQKIDKANYVDMTQQSGAGFLSSTVHDLFLWHQALQNHIIAEEIILPLQTPYVSIQMKNWHAKYGYGVFIDHIQGHLRIFHPGAIKGFMSIMNRFVQDDVCIILLSNFECFAYQDMVVQIAKIVFEL